MSHDPDFRSFDSAWRDSVLPSLADFVAIPNLSPAFDPAWAENGLQERAVAHFLAWLEGRGLKGLRLEVLRPAGRTPLIFAEVDGVTDRTVFFYGHLDKQPPSTGWDANKGPTTPVIEGGKLFGRGSVDNGYGPYTAVAALEALQKQGLPHPRAILFFELGEESGSPDLAYYFDLLKPRMGDVRLIVCPDSGCGDYGTMWFTASLRGLITGTLTVSTTREGLHSGSASGIVPSSFRVLRTLLDRIEDSATGRLLLPELWVEIPAARAAQTRETCAVVGNEFVAKFPLHPGGRLVVSDVVELMLNGTWRPTLSIVGAAGIPALETAGNVLRPFTALKLSVRIPPGVDPDAAGEALRRALVTDPPYGARVSFETEHGARGWSAPAFPAWLDKSAADASALYFQRPPLHYGEGGSIPLLNTLQEMFPRADFVVTGLGGPGSNAHGPNESLDIEAAKRLNACIAKIVADMTNA